MPQKKKYQDIDFIKALKRLGMPSTTNQVKNEVGCHWDIAFQRLTDMHGKGLVRYKVLLSNHHRQTTLWWCNDQDFKVGGQ